MLTLSIIGSAQRRPLHAVVSHFAHQENPNELEGLGVVLVSPSS
jgi:hypothetical protein